MIEAALAQTAVGFLINKAAESAAQAVGSDAYKTAIEKLKGFFNYKFAGKAELNQAKAKPDMLVSLVAGEAAKDETFKAELEKLVKDLQELTDRSKDNGTEVSNVGSVANIDIDSVSDGTVAGRDVIGKNEVRGSQNYIGGDQRGSTFRHR